MSITVLVWFVSAVLFVVMMHNFYMVFWGAIDLWRGYRVIDFRRGIRRYHMKIGQRIECAYQSAKTDVRFTRVILGDGHPVPSEIILPTNWDKVPSALGRREEIIGRISEACGYSKVEDLRIVESDG